MLTLKESLEAAQPEPRGKLNTYLQRKGGLLYSGKEFEFQEIDQDPALN